jgi:KUP system potassium uptake protein
LFADGEIDWGRLLAHVSQTGWLATQVLVIVVIETSASHVALREQAKINRVAEGILVVELSFGTMDVPDLPRGLAHCAGLRIDLATTTYLIDEEWAVADQRRGWSFWRRLWCVLTRRPTSTERLYRLPSRHVFTMCRGRASSIPI